MALLNQERSELFVNTLKGAAKKHFIAHIGTETACGNIADKMKKHYYPKHRQNALMNIIDRLKFNDLWHNIIQENKVLNPRS